MPPLPPTCLGCDRPFPRNGELASLPEGRRIAFDPGLGRVWRICTKCGEWNLLGAEAAGTSLDELTARAVRTGPGLQITSIGPRLELLRVNDLAAIRVGDLAMVERRDELSRASRLFTWIGAFLILVVLPLAVWAGSWNAEMIVQVMPFLGGASLVQSLSRHRRGLRVAKGQLIFGLLCLAAAVIGTILTPVTFGFLAIVLGGATIAALLTSLISVTVSLPSGKSVSSPAEQWDGHGVRWNMEAGQLFIREHNGAWLDAKDSMALLRHLVDQIILHRIADEEIAKAHTLAMTHSISGILGALDAWRRDRDDTLVLDDIPRMYLLALDLADARLQGGSVKAQVAHERLMEASTVAAFAESLDPPRLPDGT